MADEFIADFAAAMRGGQPGTCEVPDRHEPRPFHTVDGEAVVSVRKSPSGGLVRCLECGKLIFVPGSDYVATITVTGLPVKMQGVTYRGDVEQDVADAKKAEAKAAARAASKAGKA